MKQGSQEAVKNQKKNKHTTKKNPKGTKQGAEWSSSHTHVWAPSMPPALQSLNQPAGRVLMYRTPVHRPAATEPATRLATPRQDLIWDVQVVVKLLYISVRGPFCHASSQMSQAVTQGGGPPVALHSLLAAAAQSNSLDQGRVHEMHFLFICPLIYLFRHLWKVQNEFIRQNYLQDFMWNREVGCFFMWVLIKTYFVVWLCAFFFFPPDTK